MNLTMNHLFFKNVYLGCFPLLEGWYSSHHTLYCLCLPRTVYVAVMLKSIEVVSKTTSCWNCGQ